MHELSIATNIVSLVADYAARAGVERVQVVHLTIGALSCVHQDSLRFSFEIVAQGTPLAGAELRVRMVPLAVYCASCDKIVELPGIQRLQCPECGTASSDIRRGQELDVESIEVIDA